MKVDTGVLRVLERAQEGIAPSQADCVAMLEFSAHSVEAAVVRGVADALSRRRFGNEAIVLGQIGIAIDRCPGRCTFCSFGGGHTQFEPAAMSLDEILSGAESFASGGDLYALFLMTMHTFDFEGLVGAIRAIRERMPVKPQIVVNIGDFSLPQARVLRDAGVDGAYHVCRLGEGRDTALEPEQRKRTIRAIKDAGLDWYYCCEPIGPEHDPQELVRQLFLGLEYGCFQHAAMRRVYISHSPLARFGQITELRLAQITAVVALASLACPDTRNIAVHEPNLIGLSSGANVVYAETGANPRDTETNTSGHRGHDVEACKTMLYEAGFEYLLVAPDECRPLGDTYRK